MAEQMSTGVEVLDRELGGGLPSGSLVAFIAPPASQAELILYELTSARETFYLSAVRTENGIIDAFNETNAQTGDPEIRYVGGDAVLENTRRSFRNVGESEGLIIDPIDPLEETDTTRYQKFLNDLKNHMTNTQGLAVMHCLKGDEDKTRKITKHMADVIMDLRINHRGKVIYSKVTWGINSRERIKTRIPRACRNRHQQRYCLTFFCFNIVF
ncbi:MAG: transcriptional regulator [Halobacteriaceae archaeon]